MVLPGLLLLYTSAYCSYTFAVFATVQAKFEVFHAREKIIAYRSAEHGYYQTLSNLPDVGERPYHPSKLRH